MKSFFCLGLTVLLSLTLISCSSHDKESLPNGFVYLSDIDPTIYQDMRYASSNNFMGKALKGYEGNVCILSEPAAQALKSAQAELKESKLSLMVYDCYRPLSANQEIAEWLKNNQQKMKKRFFPHIDKTAISANGYIAIPSATSQGNNVEVTIVPYPRPNHEKYIPGEVLENCTTPYLSRFQDGGIDMGTGFDCFDPRSSPSNKDIGPIPYYHRMMLQQLMVKYGFAPNATKWWYFTFKNNPNLNTDFNFPVK